MGRYENDAAQRLPQYKINTYRHYRGSIVLFRYYRCIKNDTSKTIVLLLGVGPTACHSTGTWYTAFGTHWQYQVPPGTWYGPTVYEYIGPTVHIELVIEATQ